MPKLTYWQIKTPPTSDTEQVTMLEAKDDTASLIQLSDQALAMYPTSPIIDLEKWESDTAPHSQPMPDGKDSFRHHKLLCRHRFRQERQDGRMILVELGMEDGP